MSTNIDDLPNKVTLETKEIKPVQNKIQTNFQPQPQPQQSMSKDPLLSGLKAAAALNMTQLPSRDIPRETQHLTQDHQARPNYIPAPPQNYIEEHDSYHSLMSKNKQCEKQTDKLDSIYEELQTPIFIMILFSFFNYLLFIPFF